MPLSVGTKSVLYGAHCFFIHPWFVARAWWKLYGFPWDPRLWLCFFVHDLGYIGKPNMDGPEGEVHVYLGADIMARIPGHAPDGKSWYWFTLLHSRFIAKKHGTNVSRLCYADKYAIVLTPDWLYLPMVGWSGEINEYMERARAAADRDGKYVHMNIYSGDRRQWLENVKTYLRAWVHEHKDGRPDAWTPSTPREPTNRSAPGHTSACTCGLCDRSPAQAAKNMMIVTMQQGVDNGKNN